MLNVMFMHCVSEENVDVEMDILEMDMSVLKVS